MLGIAGVIAWNALSIDAYPDISDTTVQVVTQVPGLATEEIEQQISIPVERAVSGIPNLVTMRSKNSFGISTVVLVFDDGVDDYWARQRVTERLVGIDLPYGAVPELNPLTAPTGEIYRYIVESPDGSHDLRSLTDIHKWTIIPYLRQISGVADVSNYGGITTQYQIELSGVRCLAERHHREDRAEQPQRRRQHPVRRQPELCGARYRPNQRPRRSGRHRH